MHFLKVSVLVALASNFQSIVATPPACLLACVAQVSKDSKCDGLNDLSCLCSDNSDKIESCLKSACPNNNSGDAITAFENSCQGHVNKKVSSSAAASSSQASSTKVSSTQAPSTQDASSSAATSSPEAASSSSAPASKTAPSSSSVAPSETSSAKPVSSAPVSSAKAPVTSAAPSSTEATSSEAAPSTTVAAVSSVETSAGPVSTQSENDAISQGLSVGALVAGVAAVLL